MKKVTYLLLILVISGFSAVRAQDSLKAWKTGGEMALTFAQVSLTNWAAGGENSLAGNAFLSLFASYKKGPNSWDNNLNLGYGMVKLGSQGTRKSDDKIDFASKFGRKASKSWYYSALLGFKSQFDKGYNYPNDSVVISKFLAPGYVMVALGMDYKPGDIFSLFISPLTGRITIVNDDSLAKYGAFGVEKAKINNAGHLTAKGKKIKYELGAFLKAQFRKDIMKNVGFQTKLELFTDYLDHPENVDLNWEVLIAMKVNKYISANIGTTLVYDDNITITDKDGKSGPRTQFKEVFGVGLSYKF